MNKEILNIEGTTKKAQRETLTPYKITIVMFINIYCDESTKEVVERRDFCIAAFKLIQSPDMDLSALLNLLSSSEFVLQQFTHSLENELGALQEKGVMGLIDLFDDVAKLTKPSLDHPSSQSLLNKNSILGLYVRRIVILFERLTFYQVVLLYESLKEYIKGGNQDDSEILTSLKVEKSHSQKKKNIWGGRQAELLVAQQAHALQTDENKALPPAELQALVQELLTCSPYYAEAHYLSYLNCLRVNEYCGALDSLYHCFDRLAPLDNRSVSEDRSRTFRYAALNLAALHAQFNHEDVARSALKEAIMMAQEAGDNVCLQLAHAWMYHLTDKGKGPLIERSVGRACQLGIPHTISLGLIASAHNFAMHGENPQLVFETLMKSDIVNCQHSMIDLMSMTLTEKAALWAYYGKTEMSSICSQLLLLYNTGEKKQQMFNGSSTCQAVVNIANILIELGEYNSASVVLDHAKERFPNEPSNKIWMLSEQLYEFNQMMNSEKWREAENIASQIFSLSPLESKFRQVEVCVAKGDFPKGLKIVNNIEHMKGITQQDRVRCMLLASQITCASIRMGSNISGCNSIVLLNSALEIATKNYLSYYEALVKMHLANVQLLMGMPYQASKLVDEAIVTILTNGGLSDQGRALVLHAKCLVAVTSTSPHPKRKAAILDAIKALKKAKAHFNKIKISRQVEKTSFLISILYNELGMTKERNQCALEFRQRHEQCPVRMDTISLY